MTFGARALLVSAHYSISFKNFLGDHFFNNVNFVCERELKFMPNDDEMQLHLVANDDT